jgi:hypothetical protein
MYVPIVANPVVAAAGTVVAATGGRRGGKLFGLLSGAQTAIAAVGFVEHQRAILKKPGGTQPASCCSTPGTARRLQHRCSTSAWGSWVSWRLRRRPLPRRSCSACPSIG